MILNFGRKPRIHKPHVPHLSALLAGRPKLPPAPISINYTAGLPDDLGAMLNDQLGDCTCAAYYHARQVWSFIANGTEITEPDKDVLALYEQACGYDPKNPSTDQGGVEQDVLTYLVNTGAPVEEGTKRDKLLAFVEVDSRNLDDVKRVIADCGVAYLGINVPANIVQDGEPPAIWDFDPSNSANQGGHAIVLTGYDLDTFQLISWGKVYRMTHSFFANFVDEAYALIDQEWITATGKTPMGMDAATLEAQMQMLKEAA